MARPGCWSGTRASSPGRGRRSRSTTGPARRWAGPRASGRCGCTGRRRSKASHRSPTRRWPGRRPQRAAGERRPPVTAPAASDKRAPAPLQEFYENPEVPASSGADRAQRMASLLSLALRDVGAPACILDLGCGDGSSAWLAAQRNPGHRLVGLDWSAGSLRQARGLGLTVLRAGIERLPVASQAADVVIMSELIEHLVDTDSALEEVFRVLKPGGSL